MIRHKLLIYPMGCFKITAKNVKQKNIKILNRKILDINSS